MSQQERGSGQSADELRERYRLERDRRVRAEGAGQYVKLEGEFAHYLQDPYADSSFKREPQSRHVDVAIVGGGLAGLLTAARLRQIGMDRICVIEKGADFGGAWYWNRYPGIACDTESYIYMPLLEEVGYVPTRKYAPGSEIFEHCRRIGRHFDLYRDALLQTEVLEAHWQEESAQWLVRTNRSDAITARFLVMIASRLHRPQLPGIPGIKTFKGRSFHTSRWDYAYTGGDATGNLVGLADQRVGIIGTGATAIQCTPHLARWSKELYVFQRTPSSVDVRNDRETNADWAKSLTPGWQRERIINFDRVTSGYEVEEDLVSDGWTDLITNVRLAAVRKKRAGEDVPDPAAIVQMADDERMNRVRARIDAIVRDPVTAESLKPWYPQACKRPCFHDYFLDTFNRPNVTLVDTRGKGVERITESGAVVAGREYPLDCLIFATGFEYNSDFTHRIGVEVYGRNGRILSEKWKNGAETFHGLLSRGFPNAFFIASVQSGYSANIPHMLDVSAKEVAALISTTIDRQAKTIEPTADGEKEWVDLIVGLADAKEATLRECTPGYINNEGQRDLRARKNTLFGGTPVAFVELIETWMQDGTFKGLEIT